jgi:hypothetical protein
MNYLDSSRKNLTYFLKCLAYKDAGDIAYWHKLVIDLFYDFVSILLI